MKKYSLMLFLLITIQVSAQKFYLSPKLGLGLSDITITNSDDNGSMRPGFNIGLGAGLLWNDRVGIETGVYYLMLGNKFATDYISCTTKLDYLSIPIYAKGYIYKGLFLFAGPQFGFNVVRDDGRDEDCLSDIDRIRKFDFSMGVGAGYQWDFGLQLSASYNFGLIDAWKKYPEEWPASGKRCNNIFQFNVGWTVGF